MTGASGTLDHFYKKMWHSLKAIADEAIATAKELREVTTANGARASVAFLNLNLAAH